MLRFLHNSNATIFNFLFIGCGSCSTHRIIAFYFVSLRSLFATEANCDTLLHTCKSDGTWKIHSGNYLYINHTHLPSTSDAFISVWRSKLFSRIACYSKSNEQSNIVGFYLGIHGGLMRMNVETSMSNHLYSIIIPINPPRTKVWPNQSASHFFLFSQKNYPHFVLIWHHFSCMCWIGDVAVMLWPYSLLLKDQSAKMWCKVIRNDDPDLEYSFISFEIDVELMWMMH